MRLCLARVVTPRLTRAMCRPPYFRPYGAQALTRAVSASDSTRVPRFWRIYLALWLISRWRLPTTPCLSLPVAVSLKRFLTPLLVLSLGIFVSLLPTQVALGATLSNCHGSPDWPGRSFFQQAGMGAPIEAKARQGNLPGVPPAVAMIEAARLVEGHAGNQPPHVGDAFAWRRRRARSAHARLHPAGIQHGRDKAERLHFL